MTPTAKHFLVDKSSSRYIEILMIEFAKLHVTEALKKASEKALIDDCNGMVLEESIINAYPLENIK